MEIISSYSRAQAIEDGVLGDVSYMAKEAGFKVPVAVTSGLWADIQAIPKKSGQDIDGRLWDVLFMAHCAAKRSGSADIVIFTLKMQVGRKKNYTVKMMIGPGDNWEPVITLMRPDED